MLTGATLFSGIGAPEIATPEIAWRWCAEIDPFASAVLAERLRLPNLGDVTGIDPDFPDRLEAVDLVVFGPPCQSFSIAGKRRGLADARAASPLSPSAWLAEFARAGWFSKTSPASCRRAADETLAPFSERWQNSGMGSPTEFWTLSFSEFPSAVAGSSLSDVLETGALPQRYSLSAKACAGILRRAAKRGKLLPAALHEALMAAASAATPLARR
jgi:hypothetical protein